MKVKINEIKVIERIRKDLSGIDELALSISERGLISPIAVMESGGEYQLLAGLRRLRAMESIGETEIDAKIFSAVDAEEALKIEFAENKERKEFTVDEVDKYGELLEEIQDMKAKERMSAGGKGGLINSEGVDPGPPLEQGKKRDAVGEALGMSGRQYERIKYIAKNAPPEVIKQIDNGERSVRPVYDELRAKEKSSLPPPPVTIPVVKPSKPAEVPFEPVAKLPEPDVRIPNPKEHRKSHLKYEADDFVGKYAEAARRCESIENLLDNYMLQWENERAGKNTFIAELQAKIKELESALAESHAKIQELGGTI